MLKRLLTAVFVLGLILALNGTAFSGPSDVPGNDWKTRPMQGVTGDHKSVSGLVSPYRVTGAADMTTETMSGPHNPPMGMGADTTSCYVITWADFVSSTAAFGFTRNSGSNNNKIAMRYDGPAAPGYKVLVNGAYVWVNQTAESGVLDGQVQVEVTVYNDAGGLPGTVAYTEMYALPIFTSASGNYFYFPFTTPPLVSGAYHLAIGPDLAGPTTDLVQFISDKAGLAGSPQVVTSRGSMYATNPPGPGWLTAAAYMLTFNATVVDPNFDLYVDFCEVYSSCYVNNPLPAPGYYGYLQEIPATYWSDGSTLNGLSQRFTATAHETLKSVRIPHRVNPAYGLYTASSTQELDVFVYPDDGTGNIDYTGGPLATSHLTKADLFGGDYTTVRYANPVAVFSPAPVIMGSYHIAVKSSTDNSADGAIILAMSYEDASLPAYYTDGSGASVNFTAPGASWERQYLNTIWLTDTYGWGVEFAMAFFPTLCRDEFSTCKFEAPYDDNTSLLGIGPAGISGRKAVAHMFLGEAVNRVDKIRVQLDQDIDVGGTKPGGSVKIKIWSNAAGLPGAQIAEYYVDNADLVYWPGWTEVVIPGGQQVLGDFFVGVEEAYESPTTEFIWVDWDRVGSLGHTEPPHVPYNGGTFELFNTTGLWRNRLDAGADANANNILMEVEFCSIPPSSWSCGAADDYPTNAHDYGRTGHSNVSLSDAYCDLNLLWTYTDPGFGNTAAGGGAIGSNAPIIWDTFVVCVQNSKINILSLIDGAVLATFSGNVAPYYVAVSLVRSTPTIATINVAGIPTPVLFYGGGNSMMAVKMEVGFPVLWDIRSANLHGFSGTEVGSGYTNNSAPIVANLGGIDYVFWGSGLSRILAANAETGTKAWATTLVSNPVRNLAFDGANLYTATIAAPPTITDGDVYSIDATDGTINWQLSTAGGLEGDSPLGSTNETFADQLAVHNGELFTVSAYLNSTLSLDPGPEFADEGILYNINAATGAVKWTAPTQHFYQGGGLTIGANVIIDAARVIVAGGSTWTSTPLGGTVIAHNRFTGTMTWVGDAGVAKTTGGNLSNGFMTCEPGEASQIYLFNVDGYLSCFNGDNGSEVFHRRIDYLSLGFNSQGAGGAIADDGTVVFGTFSGQLIALKKGADRGRLEIIDYTPTTPVSFGSNPAFPVTLPAIYTNTGCATVTGTYTISTTSNGSLPGVSQWSGFDVVDRTASIADQLTSASKKAFKGSALVTVSEETKVDVSRSTLNSAALAVPAYLNDVAVNPLTVNPGDTFDITVSVNQPLMPRGPNKFYISFDTDDPDFFLNNVTEDPEIVVTLVGGCLIDTTHLEFGALSANLQAVTNSGRLGTGDWNPTPGNIKIAGDAVSFYQGTYVYGVNRNRIALNSQDWWSGGGEDDSWISMQADQNRCNNDCKPALQTAVSLGSITLDGGNTYSPLTGNMVCKDYIDSVLVFDPDGAGAAAWNWLNFETAFFDADSTMGLLVSSSTFGAVDVPAPYQMLNDVSIEVMKVKTRNGQAVNNWKFGCGIDYDVVNPDTTAIDRTISTAWTYGAGLTPSTVWGVVKLPFGGCAGSTIQPIKNAKALDRAQSMTSPSNGGTARGNGFCDSSYAWMSLAPGGYSQGSMHSADDQDAFYTFVENNFAAGGDSIQFAVAHFGMMAVPDPELSSNYAPLANLLNKWVGFGRGDINNDGAINLADIIALADNVAGSGPGAIPFQHLGDVDGDGSVLMADVTYLVDYYFHYGPCPVGKFIIQ